jgi:hypothetical protein
MKLLSSRCLSTYVGQGVVSVVQHNSADSPSHLNVR